MELPVGLSILCEISDTSSCRYPCSGVIEDLGEGILLLGDPDLADAGLILPPRIPIGLVDPILGRVVVFLIPLLPVDI
ncbi:hypothetical protein, partial [Salmonella sp. s54836]|uniref:hypothetical protein n=1 Tax=Salmonella sp. s54836 TaxID=3159673 RepID=UPI00397FFD20